MREINVEVITNVIKELFLKANVVLPEDVMDTLKKAYNNETNTNSKFMLKQIIENNEVAVKNNWPICQDTGMAVVFVEVGQQVLFVNGDINEAINKGVRQAYKMGRFRSSVADPLTRVNTKDNTPAVIHYNIIPGDKVKVSIAPKGFGSENMSKLFMLNPTDSEIEIIEKVKMTVLEAGGKPCPPIILGIGIGGTMEKAALLAKKSLLREISSSNERQDLAQLEEDILKAVNQLNVGAQGLGGKTTALGVNVEAYPTHIAGLPLAINIQCHAARHLSEVI
jgi:fumarate hydratase subunit alpha